MSSIDLQLYVCCGGPLLCPAFFEVKIFQNPFLLSFSFPLVFLSYFLISILSGFSKCLISQNIVCLIKTPLKKKTAPKQFVKGVANDQH